MYGDRKSGLPIRGEIATTDSSLGVAFTLVTAGALGSPTLGARDYIVIESMYTNCVTAGAQAICDDIDSVGYRLRSGTFPANSGIQVEDVQIICKKGVTPKFFGPAVGAQRCAFEGRIIRA